MSNDARDGVATTVVVAEHLGEKPPDGGDGIEHTVPVFDAMIVENLYNLGFGQYIRKGKPLVACKAGADYL